MPISITSPMEQSVLRNQILHPYRRVDSVAAKYLAPETQMHAATLIEVRKHPNTCIYSTTAAKGRGAGTLDTRLGWFD